MADAIEAYAEGIFDLARAEDSLERVESELSSVARAIEDSGELRSTLTDPSIPVDKKTAVVEDLLSDRASPLTLGLTRIIVAQGRGGELPEIARAFLSASAASRDREVAEVRSAVPLDDETKSRLAEALGNATGKKVEVQVVVDESVIGGLVAQVGDIVIDGSIAKRVDSIRQKLKSSRRAQ